jgi:hypothetical protein
MMSASPAIAIWKIANARTSLNINSRLHVIKAMAEKLKAKKKKKKKKELIEYVNDVLPVTWAFNGSSVKHPFHGFPITELEEKILVFSK